MKTLVPAPTAAPAISANAAQLLQFFRTERMHWIVLSYAFMNGAAGLDEQAVAAAEEELEAVDLVERAPYGPLLYIR